MPRVSADNIFDKLIQSRTIMVYPGQFAKQISQSKTNLHQWNFTNSIAWGKFHTSSYESANHITQCQLPKECCTNLYTQNKAK